MRVFGSLIVVLALVFVAIIGVQWLNLYYTFGVIVPYVAVGLFIFGFIYRVVNWARSPVPFRIPSTCGQQETLMWIKTSPVDNPYTKKGVVVRMILEVLAFRSLFRNTRLCVKRKEDGEPIVGYGSAKLLWLFAIVFHYAFLVIVLRHMRLFTEPIPRFVTGIDIMDSLFQIGVPVLYLSDVALLAGAGYLLLRRLADAKMRYLSLVNDYFPLLLILGIAVSGVVMRYFTKVDVLGIKELTMSLVIFSPQIPEAQISTVFYVHLFLVCILLAYFPFSKLMHLGGVFMSPTRNMPNDTRAKRHINPWNPTVKPRTYEEYEDEFREKMIGAGLPVEKQE